MNESSLKALVEVIEEIRLLMVASCTCGAKSPVYQYHSVNCHYRRLREIEDKLNLIHMNEI